ncbi:helix-turn-helix domain-containing protein [Bacillus nitroreducens]
MNFKLELPDGTIIVNQTELKEVLLEILQEAQKEQEVDEIMTIKEAAEFLKVSVPTLRSLIDNNEIPYFRRGQVIRLSRWKVKEWIRSK